VLLELTTNQKGLVAETAIIHEAVKLGVGVARPMDDERYDLILDFDGELSSACSASGQSGLGMWSSCAVTRAGALPTVCAGVHIRATRPMPLPRTVRKSSAAT